MPVSDPPAKPLPQTLAQKLPKLTPRRISASAEAPSDPPPETPPLPPPPDISSDHACIKPVRRILSQKDHELFLTSSTYSLLTSFIFTLADSVRDIPISAVSTTDLPPSITTILQILDETEGLLEKHPPSDTGSRFGNPIFRTYLDALASQLLSWHRRLQLPSAAILEVSTYLQHAFGSRSRIDYGSGHELNFFIWLLCLNRLSLLPPSTFPALILIIFPRYLRLVRSVQMAYYLEPAGSHGVWGLDDYQFLPFLFGASQLLHHKFIRPRAIHQQLVLDEYAKDYLYLDQVAFVNSVKSVEGLRWHSPMLDDISAAKNWGKIEGGMRKMFVKEVLGKLPVMQHFLFGSLVPAAEGMSVQRETDDNEEGDLIGEVEAEDGTKHMHNFNSWSDCCGIKVPSSIGAMQEMKKRMGGEGLRRVPFD